MITDHFGGNLQSGCLKQTKVTGKQGVEFVCCLTAYNLIVQTYHQKLVWPFQWLSHGPPLSPSETRSNSEQPVD